VFKCASEVLIGSHYKLTYSPFLKYSANVDTSKLLTLIQAAGGAYNFQKFEQE
jgi:hypothetical protein